MKPEAIISHYNRLSGKSIKVATLKSFHQDVQRCIDHYGHGPLMVHVRGIHQRITKALKLTVGYDVIDCLKVSRITITEQPPAPVKKENSLDGIEVAGLQEIDKDDDYREGRMNGVNETTYQVITDRILELIKGGGLIWRQPWNLDVGAGDNDLAHNHITKHVYRSGNYYLNYLRVGLHILVKGKKVFVQYDSPMFLSFKQVTDLGGKVKLGERGWPVVYFKWLYRDNKADKLIPKEQAFENGRLKLGVTKFPGLFYYTVFNTQQCEGLNIKVDKTKVRTEKQKIETAERIVDDMPSKPKIRLTGTEAWYSPGDDLVQVPPMKFFGKEQEFYCTEFHELIHSTSSDKRIGRVIGRKFGDKTYSFEELIAELGASYLCGESGIFYFTMKNSAAYVAHWTKKLTAEMEADPKFFLKAASQAQKAADFILDRKEVAARRQVAGIVKAKAKKKPMKIKHEKVKPAPVVKAKPAPRSAVSRKPATRVPKGVVSAASLGATNFKQIALGDRFKNDLVTLFNDSQVMIWGSPGEGKTVYALLFANSLAKDSGLKVLYVAQEEYGRSTFEEKRKLLASAGTPIDSPSLYFTGDLTEVNPKDFDVIFLDSVQGLGMDLNGYRKFAKETPGIMKVSIIQSTKDGDFRGGKDWEHYMDVAGEVIRRRLVLRKNRYDSELASKRTQEEFDSKVRTEREKRIIKEKVKEQLQPEPQVL